MYSDRLFSYKTVSGYVIYSRLSKIKCSVKGGKGCVRFEKPFKGNYKVCQRCMNLKQFKHSQTVVVLGNDTLVQTV